MNFATNKILITGGASGIGLALTERFHAAGSTVLVCGRDEAKLQAAAERLPGLRTLVCDVAQSAERQRLLAWATTECPSLNVLLNNAGMQRAVQLDDASQPWADRGSEIATNLEAPIDLCMLFAKHLQKQQAPAIINVSSGLAFAPLAQAAIYCATKAAMHSFTQSLRWQLGKGEHPVHVVEIIPPAVRTHLGGNNQSFGVSVDEFADSVMQQLAAGQTKATYGTSVKAAHASRAELDELFQTMNTKMS